MPNPVVGVLLGVTAARKDLLFLFMLILFFIIFCFILFSSLSSVRVTSVVSGLLLAVTRSSLRMEPEVAIFVFFVIQHKAVYTRDRDATIFGIFPNCSVPSTTVFGTFERVTKLY